MTASVNNFSGTTQPRAPQVKRHPRPKQNTNQRNPLDRGVRMATREMKFHIALLDAWLSNPVESAKLDEKAKGGMLGRLSFYRRELAKRDERDNRPLSGPELAQKFVQAAPQARNNGFRRQQHA